MSLTRTRLFSAVLLAAAAVTVGCEDRRYVEPAPVVPVAPAPRGVDVDIRTPAGNVTVDGSAADANPLTPRRDVEVDVGNGGVEVNVDGKPLGERIRERRAEGKGILPPPPPVVPPAP